MQRRMRRWTVLLFAVLMLDLFGTFALAADEDAERRALVRRGARLWSPYCGACHNARPASERSPAEWDTIMLHMRVRANLPAEDARALLEYLRAR